VRLTDGFVLQNMLGLKGNCLGVLVKVFRDNGGRLRFNAGSKNGGRFAPDVSALQLAKERLSELEVLSSMNSGPGFGLKETMGFSLNDIMDAVNTGRVYRGVHPVYPYSIFKYSQQTVFQQDWDDVSLACRGLIVNHDTGALVSRPFKKFFNFNEPSVPAELLKGDYVVYDKLDGSLGVSFLSPDGVMQVSTMGSFVSSQALFASSLYENKYANTWEPNPDVTYLWEIIYPENRVVVNYNGLTDIVLLGGVDVVSGASIPVSQLTEWTGPTVDSFPNMPLQAMSTMERPNREGFVVHFTETDTRVKFKHEEYVKFHRLVSGLNEYKVWDVLKTGGVEAEKFVSELPEEFTEFFNNNANNLINQYNSIADTVKNDYDSFIASLPANVSQKDFATTLLSSPHKTNAALFFLLHKGEELHITPGKPPNKTLWAKIKPPTA
jgi:RNA ligase